MLKLQPPHGWNAVAWDLAIVTVGVLLALTAEQMADAWQWQDKVHAAIVDMNDELSDDDGVQAYVQQTISECVDRRLDFVRDAIESGDRGQARRLIDTVWLPTRSYDQQALDAAIAAGVPAHLSADRMHTYRTAYATAPILSRVGEQVGQDLARLRAVPRAGGPIRAEQQYAMLQAVEALRADNQRLAAGARVILRAMQLLGLGLHSRPLQLQMEPAGKYYGGCLKPPTAADIQKR